MASPILKETMADTADKPLGKRGGGSVKAEELFVVIKRKNRPPTLPLRKISMKKAGSPPVLPADRGDRPESVSIYDRKKLLRRINIFNQDHRSFPSPLEGVLQVERWLMKPKLLRMPVLSNLSEVTHPRRTEILGTPCDLAALDAHVSAPDSRLVIRLVAFPERPQKKVMPPNLYGLGFWAVVIAQETSAGRCFRLFGLGPSECLDARPAMARLRKWGRPHLGVASRCLSHCRSCTRRR